MNILLQLKEQADPITLELVRAMRTTLDTYLE